MDTGSTKKDQPQEDKKKPATEQQDDDLLSLDTDFEMEGLVDSIKTIEQTKGGGKKE